ncbi:MAG: hypothetical protein GX087_05350 [Desulfobulbaceae bacterium]|nr:hypothetical protein [Desulfobulbaceae bacterium]
MPKKQSMLNILAAFILLAVTLPAAAAKAEGLPTSYSEFKARCQTACQSPEGAIKMYFDAVFCYLDPARRAEATKMLRYILHAGPNWERSPNHNIFSERLRDPSQHYIFRSFAAGSSPDNNYQMSTDNYRLLIANTRQEADDFVALSLVSSGADSPRRVTLKRYEDGQWYIFSNAGTYAQVRKPRQVAPSTSHDADYDHLPAAEALPAQ